MLTVRYMVLSGQERFLRYKPERKPRLIKVFRCHDKGCHWTNDYRSRKDIEDNFLLVQKKIDSLPSQGPTAKMTSH